MSKAMRMTADSLKIDINEFAVAGIPFENLFAHQWYIGASKQVSSEEIAQKLDFYLKELNDDYRTERISALKEVFVKVLPDDAFIDFMATKGKLGSAHKFPRVLKGKLLEEWEQFISTYNKSF